MYIVAKNVPKVHPTINPICLLFRMTSSSSCFIRFSRSRVRFMDPSIFTKRMAISRLAVLRISAPSVFSIRNPTIQSAALVTNSSFTRTTALCLRPNSAICCLSSARSSAASSGEPNQEPVAWIRRIGDLALPPLDRDQLWTIFESLSQNLCKPRLPRLNPRTAEP